MGFRVYLEIKDNPDESDGYYDNILREVIYESNYLKTSEVLNTKEKDIIEPYEIEYAEPLDPKTFKSAITKIYNFMRDNPDKLPCLHIIQENIYSFEKDDIKYRLSCDTGVYWEPDNIVHRDYLKLQTIENNQVNISWIKAEPIIKVAGTILTVKTITKFDEYKDILEEIIEKCNLAIRLNQKVLWFFT